MRSIDLIVIHCSASPNGDNLFRASPGGGAYLTPVQVIDSWHKERGFKRAFSARVNLNPNLESIGYHLVIYLDGAVASGRAIDEVGAHAHGFNAASIGVCLVGTDRFTLAQWATLATVIRDLQKRYPAALVFGHRELPGVHKTCPGFDVARYLGSGLQVPAGALLDAVTP